MFTWSKSEVILLQGARFCDIHLILSSNGTVQRLRKSCNVSSKQKWYVLNDKSLQVLTVKSEVTILFVDEMNVHALPVKQV